MTQNPTEKPSSERRLEPTREEGNCSDRGETLHAVELELRQSDPAQSKTDPTIWGSEKTESSQQPPASCKEQQSAAASHGEGRLAPYRGGVSKYEPPIQQEPASRIKHAWWGTSEWQNFQGEERTYLCRRLWTPGTQPHCSLASLRRRLILD